MQGFFHRQKERYEYGDLFEPIFFDMCEFVGRKGKRIRPLLFLLTYRALGGNKSWGDKSLIQAALSLELLHACGLVHVYLIDRSEKRRGLPTFSRASHSGGRPGHSSQPSLVRRGAGALAGSSWSSLVVPSQVHSDSDAASPGPAEPGLSAFKSQVQLVTSGCQ
jgi:geranylgeranyl diphosphate synthase type I